MAKAMYNDVVLAESDEYEMVEGNVYFPPNAINKSFFEENSRHTMCPWKGTASYYDIVIDGERLPAAAWYYPSPKDAAANIKDHVAFYPMVKIQK